MSYHQTTNTNILNRHCTIWLASTREMTYISKVNLNAIKNYMSGKNNL